MGYRQPLWQLSSGLLGQSYMGPSSEVIIFMWLVRLVVLLSTGLADLFSINAQIGQHAAWATRSRTCCNEAM